MLGADEAAVDEFVGRLKCIPFVFEAHNSRRGSPFNEQELEDLVQETLTTVWQRLASYKGHSSLETWCVGISLNHMKNALRKKRNSPRLAGQESEELLERAYEEDGNFDRFEAVYRCLFLLEERTLQVIRLKFFAERTFRQIGEQLGIPENTVKTTYYRGLRRLHELLGGGTTPGAPSMGAESH